MIDENLRLRMIAPTPSTMNVVKRRYLVRRTSPAMLNWLRDSCRRILPRSVIFRPKNKAIAVASAMNPNPPICIRVMITICPKSEKDVAVSSTTRPVTQVADVAVKMASINRMLFPLADAAGSESRIAPMIITAAKPVTRTCDGLSLAR